LAFRLDFVDSPFGKKSQLVIFFLPKLNQPLKLNPPYKVEIFFFIPKRYSFGRMDKLFNNFHKAIETIDFFKESLWIYVELIKAII
jgi:hypothetical protein